MELAMSKSLKILGVFHQLFPTKTPCLTGWCFNSKSFLCRRQNKQMTTTMAAEKVAGTSHLLEEILIRLPAKSLARSKLVSKQWLSQISDPQFLQHRSRHRPNKLPTGMFLTNSESICSNAVFVSFNDLNPTYQTIPSLWFLYEGMKQLVGDDIPEFKLLKSCNGLLLCLVTFNPKIWDFRPSSPPPPMYYCVCNPTTKKFRLLPPTPFFVSSILNHYLAFDPSLSLHYKVICTKDFSESHHHPHDIYIYSSENQCWSTYASPLDPRHEWFFLNGSMYCPEKSLLFHIYTEKMEQITTMPPQDDNYTRDYLPVIGNHLYCAVRNDHATADFQLLEMSGDFSEWVSKYDVSITHLSSAYPEIAVSFFIPYKQVLYFFEAMCVVEGVKEDESDLVLEIVDKVISYNLKEKTAKQLWDFHGDLNHRTRYSSIRNYQFIECLSVV